MKQIPFLKTVFIPIFLAAAIAHADLTLVEQVTSNGETNPMTLKIKGDKIRTDLPKMGVILNVATGDMTTLMKAQKMSMKISGETAQKMAAQMAQMHPSKTALTKPKATGKTEKVGNYNAEIYTAQSGNMKMKYWIAKDFPDYAEILAAMEKMQSSPLTAALKGKMPDVKDFPGMVVKSEVQTDGTGGSHTITTTLVSVKKDPLSDSEFEVPADYKPVTLPGSGAVPHAPAQAAPAPAK